MGGVCISWGGAEVYGYGLCLGIFVRRGLSRAFGHVGLCKHGSGMSREVNTVFVE